MRVRPGTQTVVLRTAVSASPGFFFFFSFLEMQNLRHHPTPTELESAVLQDLRMILRYIKFEMPLSRAVLKT